MSPDEIKISLLEGKLETAKDEIECLKKKYAAEYALLVDAIGDAVEKKKTKTSLAYLEDVKKTESSDFDAIGRRLTYGYKKLRILHACMGLTTETGELTDQLKKHIFYGKPLDEVNLIEELGDLFWYAAILAMALDTNFEEIWRINIAKLKARYGAEFSEEAALNRNLDSERAILENNEDALEGRR